MGKIVKFNSITEFRKNIDSLPQNSVAEVNENGKKTIYYTTNENLTSFNKFLEFCEEYEEITINNWE